jgi:hypothetical protein
MHSCSTISSVSSSNDTIQYGYTFSTAQVTHIQELIDFSLKNFERTIKTIINQKVCDIEQRLDTFEQTMNAMKRQKEKPTIPIAVETAPLPTTANIIIFNQVEFDFYMNNKFNSDLLRIAKASKDTEGKYGYDWVFGFRYSLLLLTIIIHLLYLETLQTKLFVYFQKGLPSIPHRNR